MFSRKSVRNTLKGDNNLKSHNLTPSHHILIHTKVLAEKMHFISPKGHVLHFSQQKNKFRMRIKIPQISNNKNINTEPKFFLGKYIFLLFLFHPHSL